MLLVTLWNLNVHIAAGDTILLSHKPWRNQSNANLEASFPTIFYRFESVSYGICQKKKNQP